MSRAVIRTGWGLAVVLSALTITRWTHLDDRAPLLIAASTGAPILLALSWPLALTALAFRARWLALTAIALTVVELVLLAPLVAGGRHASPGQHQALRVLALNVYDKAADGPAVTRQIRAAHPDVVILSELTYLNRAGLDLGQFPYSVTHLPRFISGGGIWSRYPLADGSTRRIGGALMVQADLVLPDGRRLHVQQVHTKSPTSEAARPRWQQGLADLRSEERDTPGLSILAGDFNASRSDREFRALLRDGHADAADGRGLLPTWPSGKSWIWPVLRLDHVVVSRGIGVTNARVLGPVGSDHRAVVADLRL